MTPEEIKQTWAEASRKLFRPTPEGFENMYREKKMTALENLALRYRRFSFLGMAMVFCSFAWLGSGFPFMNESLKIASALVMMAYFAVCSSIDWWLYKGISSIDCFAMSVKEVAEKALYYRKKHLQSMIFLLPFACCVVGLIAFSLRADKYLLIGIATGAIIGLMLGFRQFREFMSEYKVITKD